MFACLGSNPSGVAIFCFAPPHSHDPLVPPARAVQRSIRTRPGHCLLMSSLRLATKQHNVVVAKAAEKQELRTPRVCTCRAGSSHSVGAKSCHGLLRCQLQRFGQPCMEASWVLHTAQHRRALKVKPERELHSHLHTFSPATAAQHRQCWNRFQR